MLRIKLLFYILFNLLLAGCVRNPVGDINNICNVFTAHPKWYADTLNVQRRWLVPISIQMAIIHQESKFDASPRPQRTKLLWIIPWPCLFNTYSYPPVLQKDWALYKSSQGAVSASRSNFADRVDFIGWYANFANVSAGIKRNDAYSLYIAYHEGVGGYLNYLKKRCPVPAAFRVRALAQLYQAQLMTCHR